MSFENTISKEQMESDVKIILAENHTLRADSVNDMMSPEFVDCNPDEMTLTLSYRVKPWEANRAGILHGGISTAMLDHTVGVLSTVISGSWNPTVDMNVKFISKGNIGDELLCEGTIISMGRKIIHATGILKRASDGKTIATCACVFFNNAS